MCPGWWVGRRGCCLIELLLLHAFLLLLTTAAAAAPLSPARAQDPTTTSSTTTVTPWNNQPPQTFLRSGLLPSEEPTTISLPWLNYYPPYEHHPSGPNRWPRGHHRHPPLPLQEDGKQEQEEKGGEVESLPPAEPSLRNSGKRGESGAGDSGSDGNYSRRGIRVEGKEEEVVVVEWMEGEGRVPGVIEPPFGPTLAPPGVTTPVDLVRNTRSTPTNITKNFRQHHKFRYQLYNENSRRVIKLLTDGTVRSTDNVTDPHTLLYLHPIHRGVLEIRSEATGLFLCMNDSGGLYASCNLSRECEFMSQLEDTYYDTLQSRLFQGRYIAIANDGRIKRARQLRGRLGKEHFFLSRKVQLEEVHRIIEQYHRRLGQQPPQRCAGYNEYNMTSSGREVGTHVGATVSTAPTPQITVVPVTSRATTRPPARCRVIKGCKKCKKRKKRCKTKKCRERRRRKRKQKKDCRKKRRDKNEQEITTVSSPVEVTERKNQEYTFREGGTRAIQSQHRHRHRNGLQRRNRGSSTTNSSLQARRPRRQHQPTLSPLSSATPNSSQDSTRLSSNPRRPRLGTITTPAPSPFPTEPSSARPIRIRHPRDPRRQRRPRGPLKSPTSVAA